MAAIVTKLNFSLLLLSLFLASSASSFAKVPPTCNFIECPSYDVVHAGDGNEIRRYNSTVKNDYNQKIEMTAPVVTEVAPSDGPSSDYLFVVSFYVPRKNQANPPPASSVIVGRVKPVYDAAVRKFSGFVRDNNVGEQVAALKASIAGTEWSSAIEKSQRWTRFCLLCCLVPMHRHWYNIFDTLPICDIDTLL
ncbi:hypothetical protein K1719_034854 [Acacia pycnantha]|nr:hypothetical protein K1719_034854 [Acacia pycnantha]